MLSYNLLMIELKVRKLQEDVATIKILKASKCWREQGEYSLGL